MKKNFMKWDIQFIVPYGRSNMKSIHSKEEIMEEVKKDGYHVILFTTKWCGDCIFIKPSLPEIEENFKNMSFYEMDRDECMEFAQELDIMGIPSFVVYKDGKEISRFVSSLRKTKQEIIYFLNKTLIEGENYAKV